MRMPRALVDSSTMGAETTAEKNCAPEGLPVEEATRRVAEVLTTSEITAATPAPHRKAATRTAGGSGSHLSIHQTVARTMSSGMSASATAIHVSWPASRDDSMAER